MTAAGNVFHDPKILKKVFTTMKADKLAAGNKQSHSELKDATWHLYCRKIKMQDDLKVQNCRLVVERALQLLT